MLDVTIALTDAHPRTAVHAISRHALLPREHSWPRPAAAPAASSRSSTGRTRCGWDWTSVPAAPFATRTAPEAERGPGHRGGDTVLPGSRS
jgi:hypothetical protein